MTPEQQAEARKMFFDQFNNCVDYQHKDFPGEIFWMNKQTGEWVFNYNPQFPADLWVRFYFWKEFETKFGLNYDQTRDLLKPLIEEAFKKEVLKSWQQAAIDAVSKQPTMQVIPIPKQEGDIPIDVENDHVFNQKELYLIAGKPNVTLYQGELRQLIYQAMALTAQRNNLEVTPEASEKYIEQVMDTFLRCLRTNNPSKTINILS